MVISNRRSERRSDALTRERIILTAIEILDADGEAALTFRALAARLSTGSGAIYWHVADKEALLAAATDHVVAAGISTVTKTSQPKDAIRSLALGVFDAVEAHPWLGGQLVRNPWQNAVLRIIEGIGGSIGYLGVPEHARFNAATAVMSFIFSLAGQYAMRDRLLARDADRTVVLGAIAARWEQLDPAEYPFVRQIATQLAGHDDREQFLAGIDLILAGIESVREKAVEHRPAAAGSAI